MEILAHVLVLVLVTIFYINFVRKVAKHRENVAERKFQEKYRVPVLLLISFTDSFRLRLQNEPIPLICFLRPYEVFRETEVGRKSKSNYDGTIIDMLDALVVLGVLNKTNKDYTFRTPKGEMTFKGHPHYQLAKKK